jgi:energy-coupling factor transporter ATP-binding protein EcfA2
MSRDEIEGETDEEGKPKKVKTEFDRLSFEQYQTLKEAGEAVEDSLDLENLCRRRAEKTKYPLKDITKQATLMKALNGLITAYTRDLYYPTLKAYDGVMNQITGFKEFKTELRDKTEIAQYYRSIRKKPPQTFYCLLGKPGVGKSEISKTLAKAYKRPFNVLGMAGQSHPKILKGMRPTLDGAKYGRIVESFVDCKANIFITKEEHQATLNYLKAKDKKTKNQETYIKELEAEIKAIEEQEKDRGKLQAELATIAGTGKIRTATGEETRGDLITIETAILKEKKADKIKDLNGKKYDLPSKGPIILLDESEKVKDETVLFIVGQITDRELNY